MKELGLFPLEKRSRHTHTHPPLISVFQYLQGSYKENRGSPLTRSHTKMTKGNRYNLQQERFHLKIRKKFFTTRTINQWNNLPRDVVESPLQDVFQTQLDRVLHHLI